MTYCVAVANMAAVSLSLSRSRLIQRWVENIVEAVKAANKDALPVEKIRPHMDNLTSQLLALSELIHMYIQLYMYFVHVYSVHVQILV